MNYETMTKAELREASLAVWDAGDEDLSDEIEAIIARRFPFDNSAYQVDLERFRGILAPVDNSDVLRG